MVIYLLYASILIFEIIVITLLYTLYMYNFLFYGVVYWATRKSHLAKMGVVEMCNLRWMSGTILN